MNTTFWSNTIWYILLAVTSILSFVFAMRKSKNRKLTLVFTAATLGLTYLVESLLVVSFDAYRYHPMLVNDRFQDTVLGNVFSQVSISATSALILTYRLTFKWYLVFAAIYYLIEELFVKLGIYEQFWYKTIYTVISFIFIFWLIKKWYVALTTRPRFYLYYITLFLAVFATFANSTMMPLKLMYIQILRADFYKEVSRNHTTVAIIYGFFLINLLLQLHRWKLKWPGKGIVFGLLFIAQYFLYKAGILYIRDGWFAVVTFLDLFACYFWIVVMDWLLKNGIPADHPG
jgi:hypothetical protein